MDPTGLRIVAPAGEAVLTPDREHVVGRGRDCDVVIADGRVSRRHLRLEPGGAGWLARDISSNGIWVDGTRRVSVPLTGGEIRVHLGAANGPLVVLIPPRPAPRPAAPPPDPDVADQETILAGQGAPRPAPVSLPRQASPQPGAPAAGRPPTPGPSPTPTPTPGQPISRRPTSGQPTPAEPGPAQAAALLAGRRPLARRLHALPTLVWLAAVGFALGALIALT
ncbi:FHA domain-containing protein [Frankia sp. QA3]|uniref:FHA domain-containing protein n=1 Tax=Frankia sp. QA3 TaxID=710111 RepID=UPI000269C85C|nr:FHA domain-containing protein [Frankia sp. QA3]EIV93674.1 hypothetical protein FraQA3DRAFT_3385 [Frankia sp. QA3]